MADLGNTAVISPTDGSNGSGTMPSWLGSAAPSTLDDAGRALQGAVAREWENRGFAITSSGTAPNFIIAYTVAPAAYRAGQVYSFKSHAAAVGDDDANINVLGAKKIKKLVAGVKTALAANDFYAGDFLMTAYDGTDLVWLNWQGPLSGAASTIISGVVELLTTTELLTGTDTTRAATADSIAALWEKGSDVASATTTAFGEGGYVHITGTTTITDLDFTTAKDGRGVKVQFDGILTLTHNGTTLVLPGGANITTAVGDTAEFVQDSSDNIKCLWYTRASGQPLVPSTAGFTYVQTLNPSGVANIDTQSLAGYNVIRITMYGVTPASDASFKIQESTDGLSFADFADALGMNGAVNGSVASETFEAGIAYFLSQNLGVESTASGGGFSGSIMIYNFNQAENAVGSYDGIFKRGNGDWTGVRGKFYSNGTTARTHLRFLFDSVNISSGRIVIEGMQ